MAELLTKIPTNLTEYPNSFKRQGCFPLEAYSVFYATADKTAFEAAQDYAANNGIAYVGQTLAVVTTKVDDSTVVDDVTFYIIADAAGTLQEVGRATSGDNKSIVLDENGVLSLAGFEAASAATLPQKTPVYVKDAEGNDTDVVDHYEIQWVTIDSIVEGDTNTKTVVAAGENESHVLITPKYNKDTDTYTYEISLDLSAYATTDAVTTAIKAVEDKFDEAIGAATSGDQAATGIYAAIEAAEARAKQYADDNDTDTVYDDTAIKADIKSIGDRVTAVETAIGDETTGMVKAIADNAKAIDDEAKARATADADTLNAAKGYTDEEIVGLDIAIEKKTVNEVESDYIVIKNKAGNEVASVNAAKFVKDGMLDKAEYDKDSKKLTLTWNTDAGKNATEIELNDLIDTYTGSDHIEVGTDGVISIKDTVALKTDVSDLDTKLSAVIDTKRTESQVDDQIDAKLVDVNAAIAAKADAQATTDALALKADQADVNKAVEDIEAAIATKADAEETTAALDTKLDKSTYETDKATFAIAETVGGQLDNINDRIDGVEDTVEANTQAIEDLEASVAETYATKTELKATDDRSVSNDAAIKNLTGRLDGIVAQGGEPNVINNISVNGVIQEIADKVVDITVPTKVSDLKDGQAIVDAVNTNTTNIGLHDASIAAIQQRLDAENTGLAVLNTRLAALETEIGVVESSRIDALEGQTATLIETTTTHNTDIANLKAKDAEFAVALDTKANADSVYTKGEVDTKVQGVLDAVANIDLTPYAKVADVDSTVAIINANIAAKANASDVYTIDEADAKFLTEAQVDARVNALIGGANEADTITNVTNLIEFVNNNAGEIAKLVTDVKANGDAIAQNSADITTINAAIAAINTTLDSVVVPKASDEVSVAEDGTLGINKLNVNKLEQTAGDTLVLNGGSASTTSAE